MIKLKNISLEIEVVQNTGNIVSDMDGEKVILRIENGKYYNLGVMGTSIWNMLVEPIKIGSIISRLITVYCVEKKECENQVINYLEQLLKAGLIRTF